MKRLIYLLLFSPLITKAQFVDDFSDGDFTNSPTWIGEDSMYNVVGNELHLNAPAVTNEAHLATTSNAINNAVWEFYFRYEENPSSGNRGFIYLVSDQSDLEGSLNGYFVMIGNTADEISLYRQDGTGTTKIIDGTDDMTDVNPAIVRVQVTRDGIGNWELLADTSGGTSYVSQGTVLDSTHTSSSFFGVRVDYTSTRSTLYYFDDFNVTGTGFVDTIAPVINSVTATSDSTLVISFSEGIDLPTGQNTANYTADGGIGTPSNASVSGSDVTLTFTNKFTLSTVYNLSVSNVEDNFTNAMVADVQAFSYYVPSVFDVVINEVFPDPSPQIGLPTTEFVELYNRTSSTIDLTGWTFSDATSSFTFGSASIAANGYLILTDNANVADYTPFGSVYGPTSFPGLNNSGDDLTLRDATGQIIHFVNYEDSWYQDATKASGGYTLEMIDPNNPCEGLNNWIASNNGAGGTPGSQNSVFTSNPDNIGPTIQSAFPIGTDSLELTFSEVLDSTTVLTLGSYSVDNGLGNPTGVTIESYYENKVKLHFGTSFVPGTIYTITVTGGQDCLGNIASGTAQFGMTSAVAAGDILINEILFNPATGGVDFVEVHNASTKVIDLSKLQIANLNTDSTLNDVESMSSIGKLVFPGDYIVVTEDPTWIQSNYTVQNPNWLFEIGDLPSYNDDEGAVAILDSASNRLDEFWYTDDMHFDLYDDDEGISLERISFSQPTQDENNWHSAAADIGYATPTAENSHANDNVVSNKWVLDPDYISPDGDGMNDLLNINYTTDGPGHVVNLIIFDSRGRRVRNLAQNLALSNGTGIIRWDGINDDGEKTRKGIYVLFIEEFDLNGEVNQEKLAFSVVGNLD